MELSSPQWSTPTGTSGIPRGPTATSSPTRPTSKDSAIDSLEFRNTQKHCKRSYRMEQDRPKVLAIHHLKFAVSNLDVSIAWYERVLGARRVPTLDHYRPDGSRFAIVLQMIDWGGLYLELRHNTEQAAKQRGWDPVTLVVRGKSDLEIWLTWLDRWGTMHSPLLVGPRGWILVFEDPDGRRIRLYTKETHGEKECPSVDEYWLIEL